MLFMVIEKFRDQDVKAVYRHFRDKGRLTPDGALLQHAGLRNPGDLRKHLASGVLDKDLDGPAVLPPRSTNGPIERLYLARRLQ